MTIEALGGWFYSAETGWLDMGHTRNTGRSTAAPLEALRSLALRKGLPRPFATPNDTRPPRPTTTLALVGFDGAEWGG